MVYWETHLAGFVGTHKYIGKSLFPFVQTFNVAGAAPPAGGSFPFLSRKTLVGGMYDLGGNRMD